MLSSNSKAVKVKKHHTHFTTQIYKNIHIYYSAYLTLLNIPFYDFLTDYLENNHAESKLSTIHTNGKIHSYIQLKLCVRIFVKG